MSRIRPAVRAVLACAATAGLVAGCGSSPDAPTAPDIQTLPSPTATIPPLPSTTIAPAPTTTGNPKPANGAPPRGNARAANPGAAPLVAPSAQFKLIGGDEFNGTSLDLKKWGPYDSIGGFGNGLRRPSAISVSNGSLVITASDKVSGGMADSFGQIYGRWEFRARTDVGTGYGSAILLWPDSEKLIDGEIDIAEVPSPTRNMVNWVLHSGPGGDTQEGWHMNGDFSQWHTYAVDWLPDHITWYVDGVARYTVTNRAHIPDTSMHLAIQLDQGPVKDWMPAPDATTPDKVRLQVDWVHIYSWVGAPAPKPTATTTAVTTTTATTTTKKKSSNDD